VRERWFSGKPNGLNIGALFATRHIVVYAREKKKKGKVCKGWGCVDGFGRGNATTFKARKETETGYNLSDVISSGLGSTARGGEPYGKKEPTSASRDKRKTGELGCKMHRIPGGRPWKRWETGATRKKKKKKKQEK